MDTMSHPSTDTARLDQAWHLALTVAMISSLLAAAIGVTLYRFVGLDARLVLAVVAPAGLVVGLRLPAARPAWLPVPQHQLHG
jgi:hypothetical protein